MKIIARIAVRPRPLYANHRFVMSPSEGEEEAGEFGDEAAHSRSVQEAQRHVSEILLRLIKAAKQAVRS
jgi:hypothetical protein